MMRHGNNNLRSASALMTDPWYVIGFFNLIEIRQMLLVNRQDCCFETSHNAQRVTHN